MTAQTARRALERMTKRHGEYVEEVKTFLGAEFKHDMSIHPPGSVFLLRQLETRRPRRILELGSGFSSLIVRKWAVDNDASVFTADHDARWLGFVRDLLGRHDLPTTSTGSIDEAKALKRRFDLIFVDHGPTMRKRWEDLRWATRKLDAGGVMVLDDWWPSTSRPWPTTQRAMRILDELRFSHELGAGTRPSKHAKGVAIAWKRRS